MKVVSLARVVARFGVFTRFFVLFDVVQHHNEIVKSLMRDNAQMFDSLFNDLHEKETTNRPRSVMHKRHPAPERNTRFRPQFDNSNVECFCCLC